ncbi:NAD(P)H dehydrogenase (quinone) [Mucilaginibacter frigoritolerans]|uniref:NAD(P)H dehydrogenase (Quinone) n=1 Tax=Mucilaginibacter frigoritolerans TaxID=652788 RepID=A0A562U9Q9_9SPHI|nr:SDR family oxidoreductase [Mucilaginibacter frigoritolerans]TWJ02566.1 NAD(P)H dehydrogenase (quinone) [Mucilaginibacter frigoritolerans]
MSHILVTGATGQLGKAVTESLLKKTAASNIHILVRDAAKADGFKAQGVTIHVGDYSDYASLVSAFKGIDKVYMVSGNDIANRAQQHDNVVNAAKEAGVKHVVYTSFQRKNETDTTPIAFVAHSHLSTEAKLKASGLNYTLLQHGIYADMIPIFAGEHLLDTKIIYLPAGDGKTAFALRTDQAEAGANVLLDESGKYINKSFELAGSEGVSWAQIAEIISGITGVKINYVAASVPEFEATLTKAGVPAEYIGLFAGFSQANAQGEFENVTNELETILGRKPVSVATYLQSVYKK